MTDSAAGQRIAKLLARAGLCSRREAENWVLKGRVAVDGQVLSSPAMNIQPGQIVTVDGKPLPEAEPVRLWRYYKPRGLVTTRRDEKNRATIYDAFPAALKTIQTIGRLDLNSEGLLLLTNDGELKRRLELPATGWRRRYRVRVHGRVDPAQLSTLSRGVTIDGIRYAPAEVTLDRQQGSNAWLGFVLTEGKNREVRRLCEHMGWSVSRLIRTAYGPFQLENLEPGEIIEVPRRILRTQIGPGTDPRGGPPNGGDNPKAAKDAHRRRRVSRP